MGRNLIIDDIVYGSHELADPILIALIESKALQRLKKIAQYGLPDRWYHKNGFSRFEHTMGVTILLDKLGASEEEKIAGLLHDVSHTAFSHVVDWVVGNNKREDFQDKAFPQFLASNDELIRILEEYDYNPKEFYDLSKFQLLERELPDLCADRVDYTLREMVYDGERKEAEICCKSLVKFDGRLHLGSIEAARTFGVNYLKLQKEHWSGEQATNRYFVLSNILNEAIEKKYIRFEDLFFDDDYVISKLEGADDSSIRAKMDSLLNGNFKILSLEKKLRFVDPTFLRGDAIVRLSEADKKFKAMLEEFKSSYPPED